MKPALQLRLAESFEAGCLLRKLSIEGIAVPGGEQATTWWKFPETMEVPPLRVWDSLVCSHLLWASMLGQDLVVHGPMSPAGLFHMNELVEVRNALEPQRYHRIHISAAEVVSPDREAGPTGRTLAAFSGGLDSTFTVVRHAFGLVGACAYPLDGLVLVLGFDIPLRRKDRLTALLQRMAPALQQLNLPVQVVETNALELGSASWPQCAMPLFGAVLAQCAGPRGVGLVSGGAPYGTTYFPRSHVPPLDDLCSHDDFRLVTDGGGFGRADKAAVLLKYPEILASLRVCWQGPDPSRNCGECAKCVMTRLNFLTVGCEHPPCFDTPITMEHVTRLPLNSVYQARDIFRFCLVEMDARGVRHPIAARLRKRLGRVPPDHLAPLLWPWVGRVRRALASARGRRAR